MPTWLRTWPRQYAFALAAVIAAVFAQHSLELAIHFPHSFLLFYPTILIVALLAGFGPGLSATLGFAFAAVYLFSEEPASARFSDETEFVGRGMFVLVGLAISWFADSLRRRENELQKFANEQKQADHDLRLFRALIDQSNDAVEVVDPETLLFLDVNEKACKDLGYGREELLGMTVYDIDFGDHRAKNISQFREELLALGSTITESVHKRKDGSTFPVEISVRYVQLERSYLVTVARDVSDRKVAERALCESEDRYRDLVEHSEDLVCTHDLQGRLLSMNPAPARLLGYQVDELLKIRMVDLIAPEFRQGFQGYLDRIQANGGGEGLLCVVARDGHRRIWEYRNTLRTDGVPFPIVRGIARDVTERKLIEDALRRSEQRMRLFVEHAPAGAAVFDRQMRYVQASRRWRQDYGLEDREIVGVSHYDLFPEIPERWKVAHRRGLAGEVLREERDRFERADGTIQWVRWEIHPWYERGEIGGIAIFAEDVTERETAANALRESEERYRMLFEKTIAGVGIITMDGKLVDCNYAWARMMGYESAAECRGSGLQSCYRDLNRREELLSELRATGTFVNREWELCQKDGTPIWVLLSSVLITQGDGEPLIQSTMFDITERKRAEDALRRSEEHFRILVEQATDGIFITDVEGKYIDVNSAGAEMLGYTREEILELSISDVVIAEERPRVAEVRALLTSGQVVRGDWTLLRKDGSVFPGEISGRRLPDGRLQGILRDMTERKRAEEIVRHNEERFRVALKDSPITVFNQDRTLRYTWLYNPQLHWQHDVIGKTDDEIIGSKRAAAFNQLKKRVLESGVGMREEVAIPSNGTSHVFDVTIEPLMDDQKEVIGITAACMDIARLREMADRLQESRDRLVEEKSYLEHEIQTELGFENIMGQSPALREVLKKARIVAPTDSTVLLLGETGTGKELVARSIHKLSARSTNTFVKLNCAAVPSGLLESELFGHEKGAFTGAVNQKIGRIELADKGTLFLDEIGEMPLEQQPKLLRVLQDREFERLGGVRTLKVDVRIISATNRDLQKDITDKKFREDLFYRLNVFPIELPPLRERRGDVAILIHHFVQKHAGRMGKRIDVIPDLSVQILNRWNWPGNIRELENVVERMVIMSKGSTLAPPPAELSEGEKAPEDNLTEMEREHILRVLRETNGVLSGHEGAAVRLGLKRTTLQSMIKRLRIQPHEYRNGTLGMFGR